METVTHILSGALIARAMIPTTPPQANRQPGTIAVGTATLCGAAAAAFPDIDFVAAAFGRLAYLLNHRGITHSLVLLPFWALLVATLYAALTRQRHHWRAFYPFAFAGIFIHILGDLCNSFGTMILAPFSDHRYGWGTTFIFDFWLSGIIIAGLLLSFYWRHSRLPAVAAVAVMLGYIGFQSLLKERAIEAGEAYAHTHALQRVTIDALPQAFSPFRWMVIVKNAETYWHTHINLLHAENSSETPAAEGWFARFNAAYQSVDHAVWQRTEKFGVNNEDILLSRQAFEQPCFAFYRWFAAYPALYRIDRDQNGDCVWFQDLRFKLPGLERSAFQYGMCAAGKEWLPVFWAGNGVRKILK